MDDTPSLSDQIMAYIKRNSLRIVCLVVVVLAWAIIVAHHAGVSPESIEPWREHWGPTVTLTILALFAWSAVFMLTETGRKVDRIGELLPYSQATAEALARSLDRLLDQRNVAETEVFGDADQYYRALTARVKVARERIDTVNFIREPPKIRSTRMEYYEALKARVQGRRKVKVRRIAALCNADKRDWLIEEQVKEFAGCPEFSAAAVRRDSPTDVPLLTIIIIDDEVFMGMYWGADATHDMEQNLRLRSPVVARAFSEYYRTLWEHRNTVHLVINGHVKQDAVDEVNSWTFQSDSTQPPESPA